MFRIPDVILKYQILPFFLESECPLKGINKEFNKINYIKYCAHVQPHGIIETYHWKTKKIFMRYSYMNGKRHGLEERWYENGLQEYKCNYVDGILHGLCECWYENGQQEYKFNYENGI